MQFFNNSKVNTKTKRNRIPPQFFTNVLEKLNFQVLHENDCDDCDDIDYKVACLQEGTYYITGYVTISKEPIVDFTNLQFSYKISPRTTNIAFVMNSLTLASASNIVTNMPSFYILNLQPICITVTAGNTPIFINRTLIGLDKTESINLVEKFHLQILRLN